MVSAGTAIVDSHGSTHAQRLLPLFESYLDDKQRKVRVAVGCLVIASASPICGSERRARWSRPLASLQGASRSKEEEAHYDLVREGVVVFLGTLARHLPADDPKRRSVVETLVTVLSTPSEAVQVRSMRRQRHSRRRFPNL